MNARNATLAVVALLAGAVAPAPTAATTCTYARLAGTLAVKCLPYSGPATCAGSTLVLEESGPAYVKVCVPKVIEAPPTPTVPPIPPS